MRSLGSLEVVTASSNTSRQDKHIDVLEALVDDLRDEVRLLKSQLKAKPSTITQEQYDELCARYQLECSKSLPF